MSNKIFVLLLLEDLPFSYIKKLKKFILVGKNKKERIGVRDWGLLKLLVANKDKNSPT